MSGKRQSETEIQHEGANLREQLHAIVSHELEAFADVDRIGEVSELQDKVDGFMKNLQIHFDSYIHEIEKENAEPVSEAAPSIDSASAEEPAPKGSEVINLEKEFHTYGITKANGIDEEKKPLSHTLIQAAVGTAIAAALLWVFWPTSEQQAVVVEAPQTTIESSLPDTTVTDAEDATADANVIAPEVVVTELQREPEIITEPVAVVVEEVKPEPVAESVTESTPEVEEAAKREVAPESKPVEKQAASEPKGQKITVTAHFGNVRNAPDNTGKVISRLKKGDVVYKLEENDGWFHVRLNNDSVAWVHHSVFAPRLQVTVDLGNIRSEPNSKGEIVTRLKKGAYITKMGEKKDWYQVKLDSGTTAWAHRSIF
ncbi:SH3 domain-containing protein [Mariprofundus ferrinatatus]|uniref:SH3 domain-containing protein n=1 Tax=Mariprofundus ferrinatatus TaxID=1921087 RepID=A0A2K8L3M8_9PROT|nr:SH3 domain-containing protein [Mariprofundus ferrinatatus]ATX81935.1 SH3 domain-containing protein [Mariprofundus ferrinatatus]